MRIIRSSLPILMLALAAAPAAAQDAAPVGPFPNLATLDRTTDHSSFNSSLALSFFGDDGPDLAARIDLGGQYVTPQGFGGYAQVPISYLSFDDETGTALGNIELGGVYVARAAPSTGVVIRGGLVLPTSPDDSLDLDGLAGIANVFPRFTDLTSVIAETTFLRLSASPLHRRGQFFARADLGLDIAIDQADGSDIDPLVRINLAAGIEAGKFSVAGELVTLGTTGDVDDDEDRFLHTIAVSAGMDAGSVRPYGALIIPLDNDLADVLDLSLAIMAGIEVPFGAKP